MVNSKGKGKAAIVMIKPTSFYSNECEKIKLNWFCYELSMGIYDNMRDDLGYRLKRHKISEEVLADFSICTSKKLKDAILRQLSGKDKNVCISYELIESYFPDLENMLNRLWRTCSA